MNEQDPSYASVVKFEHAERGSYGDLSYQPTFRASAIFFVLVNKKIDTLVSFMNYWKEKNHNEHVAVLITLRDEAGKKIHRKYLPVKNFVYQFNARDLLGSDSDFMGSLEIELFSDQDLKYAFPAIYVFYRSPDGISFVHSNQRTYNDIEDMDRGNKLNDWQTDFDISIDGYFTFVNGQRAVPNIEILLEVFNMNGDRLQCILPLGNLPAYGTRMILLRDIPGTAELLGDDTGFCKITVNTFGIFMRIACGNIKSDHSRMTVTHSFYDCTNHTEYAVNSDTPPSGLTCFTPIHLVEGLETELVFYPTYAKSELIFSLHGFKSDGSLDIRIGNIRTFTSPGTQLLRMNIRSILKEYGAPENLDVYCLVVDSYDGKIPSRLTYGLNYSKNGIGCNISDAVFHNQSYGKRKRVFRWGSAMLRTGAKNTIFISHFSPLIDIREQAEIHVKLYAKTGIIVEKTYSTGHPESLAISVEELVARSSHQPAEDEVLWYTAESACPNYTALQLHIASSGFVGGDHSF